MEYSCATYRGTDIYMTNPLLGCCQTYNNTNNAAMDVFGKSLIHNLKD